ncbi:Atu4866 domain-containing protein [Micromonospora sp. NPDC047467]|uniref:Atu4866 domain-containing protein n=1 Tax=Micromonospora sp. NPDC047467 TaxID=3154814 RepID=UPI0033E0E39A
MSGIDQRKAVATFFATAALTACGTETPSAPLPAQATARPSTTETTTHGYVGMWVTADNQIRQELLANGRYNEARGQRDSAYTGRYEVTGDHIDYWDDTGFTADGRFEGDVLHHGGYLFYREGSAAHRQAVAARGSAGPSSS